MVAMKDAQEQTKQQQILQAAWQAFAAYGFRKTSMDDIARGAGMSRPAVYLHYRNKDDIFRSLVQFYYDTAADAVSAALSSQAGASEVLAAAFEAQVGETMEAMLTSPHGMELLDMGIATASDIKAEGEARISGLYSVWLQREADAGRITLSDAPEAVAATIGAALRGIKMAGTDIITVRAQLAILAQVIGAGLIQGEDR